MMPVLDSTLEISVPYSGFAELAGQAFALAEAVRARYDLSVEEFFVFAINQGYKLSGRVERNEAISDDGTDAVTFGYDVTLIVDN